VPVLERHSHAHPHRPPQAALDDQGDVRPADRRGRPAGVRRRRLRRLGPARPSAAPPGQLAAAPLASAASAGTEAVSGGAG